MEIDLFNNSGIKTFKAELEDQMLTASSFDIAAAFITEEAIELIQIFLTKNKNKNRIGRLISGFYHCFNSKSILLKLQSLSKKSNGRLLISMSKKEKFHWKYYHFENRTKEVNYIGSANFTTSGMNNAGELILKLSLTIKDNSKKKSLKDLFNKEFANSVDIKKIPLEDYQQTPPSKTNGKGLSKSIKEILKQNAKTTTDEIKQIHAILLKGDFNARTKRMIKEKKSNWNDFHFACYGQSDYQTSLKADLILIISYYNRRYSFNLAKVVDSCQLKTLDGNYFIAYENKTTQKNETIRLRNELKNLGLHYRSRGFKEKVLRNRQSKRLLSLFSFKS